MLPTCALGIWSYGTWLELRPCTKQRIIHILALTAYTDADKASQATDRPISTTTIPLNDRLVDWYCTKQINVPLSTMEFEFVPRGGSRASRLS